MAGNRCVILQRGRKVKVLGCSTSRQSVVALLNRCYAEAHPTKDECRSVHDSEPALGRAHSLGATRTTVTKRSGMTQLTRFENGWQARTFPDPRRKRWTTQVVDDENAVVEVIPSSSSDAAEDTHEKAVTAIERYAQRGLDPATFRARRGGVEKQAPVEPTVLAPMLLGLKDYNWFVITRSGKIAAGYEYRSDAADFVSDNKQAKLHILGRKALRTKGVDPLDTGNWTKGASLDGPRRGRRR